jgi:hypothetical protein
MVWQNQKMGQYYKIIFLDEAGKIVRWISPWHPHDSGIKLTEHCYLKNSVCTTVEYLLSPLGENFKGRIVWAGDYADPEPDTEQNLYHIADDLNLYQYAGEHNVTQLLPYIVNHTKKLFVDKRKKIYMNESLPIHPLPFLTAEGCGASGSDIHTRNELLGSWARDVLSVEREVQEGYNEIVIEAEGREKEDD